jgi:peroxiredoxin
MSVNVAAVTLGKPGEAKLFCAQRSPDLNCLSDPHQLAYATYGIKRMNVILNSLYPQSWFNIVRALRMYASLFLATEKDGPQSWFNIVRALRAGHRMRITDTDMLQLSATFVIDTQGVVRFAHYNRYTSNHPDWKKVQAAAEKVNSK